MTKKSNFVIATESIAKCENVYTQKPDIFFLVSKKIDFFYEIIQKTIVHVQKNKILDLLGITDVSTCIEKLNEVNTKIQKTLQILNTSESQEQIIGELQIINNDLSLVLKNYGTESLEDLLLICFGANYKLDTSPILESKLELLKKYFHPTSYKVINKKEDYPNDENLKEGHSATNTIKIVKNSKSKPGSTAKLVTHPINNISTNILLLDDNANNIHCADISSTVKLFHLKVYGIKLIIKNSQLKKSLVIYGILDDIIIDYLSNGYICEHKQKQIELLSSTTENKKEYESFLQSLTLKDYLIFNNATDFFNKFIGMKSHLNSIKQKQIAIAVKEFIADELYTKRNTLLHLLVNADNRENQYLAYLLYDLLSNDTNGHIDTQEQTILYDSFPWIIKQHFKNAMKKTIQYTHELTTFDINKIPLEQQICLIKAPDTVKEKAMLKLKEVKAKSEDSGTKARQYLDGLLKIPFGIYKKEPILNVIKTMKEEFIELSKKYDFTKLSTDFLPKENYTNLEIYNCLKRIKEIITTKEKDLMYEGLKTYLLKGEKAKLQKNIQEINTIILAKKGTQPQNHQLIKGSLLKKEELKQELISFIETSQTNNELLKEIYSTFQPSIYSGSSHNSKLDYFSIYQQVEELENQSKQVATYLTSVKDILDTSVYGHDKAKRQIERIIAQWMNGEQKGYACGFEGPPGVGKTSLAKGLANCLKDAEGNSRPFSLIAIGGDSNASSLIGHSYTYVGSTWGQILQILMDKKCMNPIILIDEVDKISKTEHGKEITGVLTHLLDPTQNEMFQDKYFSGVDLDLSKVLFILSYNDVNEIDRIMLDRITRIKFDTLSLEDKLVICNKHLLPDIYTNMGLEQMIEIKQDVLKFIINEYTLEAGVRKLKEILLEIVGEINLEILQSASDNEPISIPIVVTIENVKTKYLKDKKESHVKKVFMISKIGFVNGMYATSLGNGGTLPIHAQFYPSSSFLELKLTGLQQEVMKESMHVALTVAWNLTDSKVQTLLREKHDDKYKCGINIHTGDGATQKDGPSAGCAIACAIYSLLNNVPLKGEFGITGEIQMTGEVTAIGGLAYKILGSLKSGVKHFIYPKENKRDFDEFMQKYKDREEIKDVQFYPIEHVEEALHLLLDNATK